MGYHYTVWVGGVEVTDHWVSVEKAREIAQVYIDDGYADVKVMRERL